MTVKPSDVGLTNQSQVDWLARVAARIRARVGDNDVARRLCDIAFATILTESNAYMYANKYNPDSLRLPHDRIGSDHGSVGLYQQQVGGAVHSTANWGTVAECMDVNHSTDSFIFGVPLHHRGLTEVLGVQFVGQRPQPPTVNIPNWTAAQRVQGSFDPTGGNYRRNDDHAIAIRRALWLVTPRPVPAPNPHAPIGTYRVQKGDTLTEIAHRYSQAWITAATIAKLNRIKDQDKIYAGQVLTIG